jgi:hypothetical protein
MRTTMLIILICVSTRVFSQTDTIKWVQLSSLQDPDSNQREAAGYFLIDSDFFVAGGEIGLSYSTISVVWRYHIPTDTWYQMRNLPFGAAAAGASFVINGKGYFLTARDSVNNGNCDTMLWEYNPTIDVWTKKARFPDQPRQNSSYFSYNEKGYLGQTDGCSLPDNHFW